MTTPYPPQPPSPSPEQPADAVAPRASGIKRIVIGSIVGALLLAVAGVGTVYGLPAWVYGPQPETRVPANALVYAELDLAPSLQQQVGAYRFARKFPMADKAISGDDKSDPRRQSWDALTTAGKQPKGISFERDIQPWLGKRAAVAVLPGGPNGVELMAVVQVKNEAKARAGVQKLRRAYADHADNVGMAAYTIRNGYLIGARTQQLADRFEREGRKKPLSANPQFKASFKQLGNPGIFSGYADLDRVQKVIDRMPGAGSIFGAGGELSGRVAWGLRFDGDDAELIAVGRGLKKDSIPSGKGGTGLETLPSSTVAAYGAANLGPSMRQHWEHTLAEAEKSAPGSRREIQAEVRRAGLKLPQDLSVLVGRRLVAALDVKDLATNPHFGLRITTDGRQFKRIVDRVVRASGAPDLASTGVRVQTYRGLAVVGRTGDGAYLSKLAKKGHLGKTRGFRAALPDIKGASVAMYADVDILAKRLGGEIPDADVRESLTAIDGVGLTVRSDRPGEFRMRLRVVTK